MKNKAFLSILEQLCMILVFAAASAICLRVFSLANEISQNRDALDKAVAAAQYTAELLKSSSGDFESCAKELSGQWNDEILTVICDASGAPSDSESEEYFHLTVLKTDPPHPLTEQAQITVSQNDAVIYTLSVVWQTDDPQSAGKE